MTTKEQPRKWVINIVGNTKAIVKSLSGILDMPMCEIVEVAIKEYIERIQTGDFEKNLAEIKDKRKHYLRTKKLAKENELTEELWNL